MLVRQWIRRISVGRSVGGRRRTLSPEEFAGDVELFASDDDDLLAVEELLCDSAGETTEEVSLAIDDDLVVVRMS